METLLKILYEKDNNDNLNDDDWVREIMTLDAFCQVFPELLKKINNCNTHNNTTVTTTATCRIANLQQLFRRLIRVHVLSQSSMEMQLQVLSSVWSAVIESQDIIIEIQSAFLCILGHEISLAIFTQTPTIQLSMFVNLITKCFLHQFSYMRRRGAYLFEMTILPLISSFSSTISTDGWHGRRSWLIDFSDCFAQIENSSSLHLVKQIVPYLKHIFQLSSTLNTNDNNDKTNSLSCTFVWARILFHCLHKAQIPTIRKYAIELLFSGDLMITPSEETTRWLCTVLASIDSTMYFPINYIDIASPMYSKLSPIIYPGILFRAFFERTLQCYILYNHDNNSIKLAHNLLQSFLHQICSMTSLCAIKWLISAFYHDDHDDHQASITTSLLINNNNDTQFNNSSSNRGMLQGAFNEGDVNRARYFVVDLLYKTNERVRKQVLQGLLPLLLTCTEQSWPCLFALLRLTVYEVGLTQCLLLCGDLLVDYITSCFHRFQENDNNRNIVFSNTLLHYKDMELLAIAICLAQSSTTTTLSSVPAVFTVAYQQTALLYHSPYMSSEQQLSSLWLMHGLSLAVKTWTLEPSVQRYLGYVQRLVLPDIVSFTSYLKHSIYAAAQSTGDISIGSSLSDLDACCAVFGSLLLLPSLQSKDNNDMTNKNEVVLIECIDTLDFLTTLLTSNSSNNHQQEPSCVFLLVPMRIVSLLLPSLFLYLQYNNSHGHEENSYVIDNVTSVLIINILKRLVNVCMCCKNLTSAEYQRLLLHSSTTNNNNYSAGVDIGSNYGPALRGYSQEYTNVGRAIGSFVENKWQVIRVSIQCLTSLVDTSNHDSLSLSNTIIPLMISETPMTMILAEQLSLAPATALSDILYCCRAVVRLLYTSSHYRNCRTPYEQEHEQHQQQQQYEEEDQSIDHLLQEAWTAVMGADYISLLVIDAFVSLALDPVVIRQSTFTLKYYDLLFAYGSNDKPHILRVLFCHLVNIVWKHSPDSVAPFLARIHDICLYKEPKLDDNSEADYAGTVGDGDVTCRLLILQYFESLNKQMISLELSRGISSLIRDLVYLNLKEPYMKPSMVGTELFGHKLRSWQALCVLSKFVTSELCTELASSLFVCLLQVCSHGIRVYMEVFIAALTRDYQEVMMPLLLAELAVYNHPQQTLASHFMILGHLFLEVSAVNIESEYIASTVETVVLSLASWLSCANGLPRSIAQVVMLKLIPLYLSQLRNTSSSVAPPHSASSTLYLTSIQQYLEQNTESVKLMRRQQQLFIDFPLSFRCTVGYLLRYKIERNDDIIPEHILDVITEFYKEYSATLTQAEDELLNINNNNSDNSKVNIHLTMKDDDADIQALQTKRTSFEELQLMLDERHDTLKRNAAEVKKQSLVVVASLVDKVTNLAGIARTCEIFAIERLCIADMRVLKSDVFLGIAVSSESWLDIQPVKPDEITTCLREYKRLGYIIVGVEQTDTSKCLSKVQLPEKCVLLLGKEKEGISVDLLFEVDICVEIPQLGVIRSLNVHVSAALAVWEYSKQHAFSNYSS